MLVALCICFVGIYNVDLAMFLLREILSPRMALEGLGAGLLFRRGVAEAMAYGPFGKRCTVPYHV